MAAQPPFPPGFTPPEPAPFRETLVFVDLETTGANPVRDRITEVGIVEVSPAGVTQWSSLVNPGIPIPPFIQGLTHISDEMVASAPPFAALADEVLERLKGRLFVAHNARFDYGFLKNEFRRLGLKFHADVLCTVKLSRKLEPQHHRHSLDALVERHKLYDEARHRALSDARLIHQFWDRLHCVHPAEQIWQTVEGLTQRPKLPPQLPPEALDDLPELPGVYLLYGQEPGSAPLYIGKSSNLRQRVFSHFSGDKNDARDQALATQVYRIDWQETAGELGATLLEARLMQAHQPPLNRHPKKVGELCAWQLVEEGPGDFRSRLALATEMDFGRQDDLYGLFNSAKEARNSLKKIADAHHLCHVLLGLEAQRPGKPCFGHQMHNCKGACCGKEPLGQHSARLMTALAKLKLKAWPYGGPVGLVEKDDFSATTDLHLVDHWVYLGTARQDDEIPDLLAEARRHAAPFDPEIYRLLNKAIAQGSLEIRTLSPAPPAAE
jgi:DNA polymerase-3 subunit epsilon